MDGSEKLEGIDAWASLFGLDACQSERPENSLYKVNLNRYQGDAVVGAIGELHNMAVKRYEDYKRFVDEELQREREVDNITKMLAEKMAKDMAEEMAEKRVKEMMEEMAEKRVEEMAREMMEKRAKEESEKL
eukprot:gnl/Chilomastix_caulleri/2305.p1 GENE.gnl/Chilomastix_caulleri/2305~~gnl/Chilomastix_caulleri/2305.p1  ORF type:complete len:132 (+),score=50.82 gnl/Chilomastix_caulleri/2305:379-774(+)